MIIPLVPLTVFLEPQRQSSYVQDERRVKRQHDPDTLHGICTNRVSKPKGKKGKREEVNEWEG